ncbi:MAG: molybdopterin molybdotransferase MoeA [Gammaproteobacteria bacterium]|nr:molybdopterin molybdotransferase MoeA [Gammaproteobacteria bacterium]
MTTLLDLDTALHRLLDSLEPLPAGPSLPIAEAHGYYLACDQLAAVAVPPFANSAMDGYAVASQDEALRRGDALVVSQRILAGGSPGPALASGCCARIFTGAPLPDGADAIIAQEDARILDDGRVQFDDVPGSGNFVRPRGGDVEAGAKLAHAGDPLHPARLALLIAAGLEALPVHPRPRVAIVTTGDELCAPGTPLAAGQIYDSNATMLAALARDSGAEVMAVTHAPDDPTGLREVLDTATGADAIICSGGVSVGEADYVREVLASAGEVSFWKLALKPGKPFAYGRFRGRPLFGLPGNPVSALVTFLLLVRPALQRMAGAKAIEAPVRFPATLTAAVRKRPGRRDFQRGEYRIGGDGRIEVSANSRQDSNILSALTVGNCLIDLPREQRDLDAGERVWILPLTGWAR